MFAADKPIRHVEDDKYGREKYVDNLAYALLTGDDSDGLVVGIEGAWGSGKTSLKNMLIERLQQMPLPDRKTHLIEFDAWMYSRSGEIVSALFSEISAGLSPRLKWYQKLLMRFDCFNNNAITSVVHLIYRAINAVLPYSEIGISIGCISWSFQNLRKFLGYLYLARPNYRCIRVCGCPVPASNRLLGRGRRFWARWNRNVPKACNGKCVSTYASPAAPQVCLVLYCRRGHYLCSFSTADICRSFRWRFPHTVSHYRYWLLCTRLAGGTAYSSSLPCRSPKSP